MTQRRDDLDAVAERARKTPKGRFLRAEEVSRLLHYVLYVDRMVTPLVGIVRDHIPNWVILFMTRSTIAMELLLPFVLFMPIFRAWARRSLPDQACCAAGR